MAETKTLVWLKPLKYSGLFDISELYKVVDNWCKEHHYDKVERKNFEEVFEKGKQFVIELVPYKKITDYAKVEIRVYMEFTNCTEEVVERSGMKHKLFKGDAFFSFDCFLKTDYEGHWETKPVYYFFRTLVDKFIYKNYSNKQEAEAGNDAKDLQNEIKSFLNMQRFK